MNANDVIESYVAEVAVQLPRRQRNDVAFELRALLDEELQAKANAAGHAADAAMAIALLRAFGRPEDVAARYRPAVTIVDPVDGRNFLRALFIGLAIIWCLGLLAHLRQPLASGEHVLSALGRWWGGTVVSSLWWPGLLVVGFGTAAWVRRRWPRTAEWKPRAGDRIQGGRAGLAVGLVGILCGVFVLVNPHWLLDVVWGGRAAPAAYEALTYTDTFLRRQALWLLALLLLNVPLLIAVIVKGRWSAGLRRAETGLAVATCAAMAWTVLDGPVLIAPHADRTAKFLIAAIIAYMLIHFGVSGYRSVKPTPAGRIEAR